MKPDGVADPLAAQDDDQAVLDAGEVRCRAQDDVFRHDVVFHHVRCCQ